jgi:hypothetical protein
MKKILLFLNIILVAIIGFMARNSNYTAATTSIQPDSCLLKFCNVRSELTGMIDGALLKAMSESYANDPGKAYITRKVGRPGDLQNSYGKERDGWSMVFGLEKLKTLIWQMQKNACDNHCDPAMELGVRFYYIKYPSNTGSLGYPSSLKGLGAEVKDKHALVMVPCYRNNIFNNTVNNKNHQWYDYDLWGGRPGCFNRIDTARFGDPRFKVMGGIGGDFGDNHGGVSPPPEPGTFPTNPGGN